ncbi:hypothetical protein [Haliangium sp.]|uniref:hypothetical protein n=1 Tax=Haliangium sp. TaxID=2663208 RepID=UPI003D10E1AE
MLRSNLCHAGAEVSCGPNARHQPNFGLILQTANRSPNVTIEPAPETYCTGQTVDGQGYATTRPALGEVQWQCAGSDEQELADVQPLGFGGSGSLDCRVRKALVECVEPNLLRVNRNLDPVECTLYKPADDDDYDPDGDGVVELRGRLFTATDDLAMVDYCISIVLGVGSGDHASTLAIDFNNGVFPTDDFDPAEQYNNSGNITGCVGAPSGTCSNIRYTPRIDLPPVFVSIMEGCGFEWLGRFDAAEGGYLGCDPMHFALPQ